MAGHNGYVNTVAVSPDGSLCASGGKDGVILLWDLAEGKRLYSLDAGTIIHALCFSPNRYWLCAATESGVKIWDLESKSIVEDLKVDLKTEADHLEGSATTASKKKVKFCCIWVIYSLFVVFCSVSACVGVLFSTGHIFVILAILSLGKKLWFRRFSLSDMQVLGLGLMNMSNPHERFCIALMKL